ncbi:ribosome maturation factor RimP [Lactococcus termiticola]|uniref:Ribosome maturation factor RimP n=1 Tax=Lactococcus termiticola TaxID=2169526 RepID=A0A2R5HKT1_9LACT|nr:ribosome maturation factor RimP [Lactococcus termiticola]GBG97550.1 ribosome maturation protein RimP [Lactococcus termiticola]
MDIPEIVEGFIAPKLPEPYEIVDVEWERLGADEVLRILIDKPEGVSIQDTADLSEIISPLLDEITPDPFPAAGYMLEVASPGAERPLKKAEDFERFVGEYILVKLYQKIEGEKEFAGDLVKFSDNVITIDILDKTRHKQIEIPLDKIAKAQTLVKL